ncbi:hypothetical protein [uncultured Microscilla sp.]|uniref:hypothetical protein n=1 Tax=uncultured Microscilla sp. TaxID=432653 RepID=UPI0026194A33|nr:hypothetical protein [uncultured Microscilla sp.]
MSNTSNLQSQNIQWKQVWSLIALNLAIVISWVAYNKYQPELLTQFRFSQYVFELAIVQGLILFVTPPIAGWFADKARLKGNRTIPVVGIGINFVSMVFMVVAVTVWANPGGIIRMFFPLMIVLWLVFMNVFHSPAISTLDMFVPREKLPQIMAIFAVITDMAASIEPSIIDLITFFGAPITFAAGGLMVFGAGLWLQSTVRSFKPLTDHDQNTDTPQASSRFGVVLLLGLFMGFATMYFFELFPNLTAAKLPFLKSTGFKSSYFTSILIAFSALLCYPLSLWAQRFSVIKAAWIGVVGCAVMLLGISVFSGTPALVCFILYPIFYALMSVTFLPLAFVNLSSRQKVLGIGLFFSGVQLASSVAEALQAGKFI